MTRYAPTRADNETLLEVYRERNELQSKSRLALDRWDTLSKSAEAWLARRTGPKHRAERTAEPLETLLKEGNELLRRVRDGAQATGEITTTYRRWTNVLQGLAFNPEGSAEDLARHFLRLTRTDEALAHYRRLGPVTTRSQAE